ncbi:hypothetical protein ACFC58_25240 [Kitasatospora purpeofusca]|uniref:hypothetical protein n=1 Tax=Kitasatospora purpeofusca TaxID=67352 RepID=UPI0035D9B22B
MSTAPRRTAVGPRAARLLPVLPVLLAAALALPVGCAAPGELRDHGAVAPATPSPASVPLWPGAATAPSPTPLEPAASRSPEAPPQPVPDLTVVGQDVTAVDVRTLLTKDPGVTQDERRVLEPCPGCELRAPEYRDLTGDGRPELLLAVGLADAVVLHVYTAAGDRLLPIHRVSLLTGFGAKTVGTDLWLYEPTTASSRTGRLYRWDGVRLALADQKVEGIGPTSEPEPTPSAAEKPTVEKPPGTGPTAVTGGGPAKPVAPSRPSGAPPSAGAGSDPAVGKQPQPTPARPAPPTATPTAAPLPETKP